MLWSNILGMTIISWSNLTRYHCIVLQHSCQRRGTPVYMWLRGIKHYIDMIWCFTFIDQLQINLGCFIVCSMWVIYFLYLTEVFSLLGQRQVDLAQLIVHLCLCSNRSAVNSPVLGFGW